MSTWHLIIDVDRCEDCNNCLLACKDEHVDNAWPGYTAPQPRHGHRWIDVRRKERGEFPLVDVAYLPLTCMQCEQAPCIEAGKGAIFKRSDGIVLIDTERARGHKELLDACPYGAIWWNEEEQLPQKCTLCAHLLDAGWTQTRCVQACPTGALRLVREEEADFAARVEGEGLQSLLPEAETRPTVVYRNLARWEGIRVAGTVTLARDGVIDCAKGARVALHRGDAVLRETQADAFGDYVFDGVATGDYAVTAELEGFAAGEAALSVQGSCTADPIHLELRQELVSE
ncbi:MAG: carboxypeptidase regulatory-like domain-containing protein [Thermoleophilia bacterium]|nr:carboxypeptidase regulatory-like domain-containing protein [Thermoleophilia bacterium]